MALRIPSNIRQVHGTSAQVQNISTAAGSLFYDTGRELFLFSTQNGTKYLATAGDIRIRTTIYVDSVNGSDDNTGFSEDSYLKTLDKAISLLNTVYNNQRDYTIKLAAGEYTCSVNVLPRFTDIDGAGIDKTTLIMPGLHQTNRTTVLRNMTINISDYSGSFCLAFYTCHVTFNNVRINITGEANSSVIYVGDLSYMSTDNLSINCNNKSYKDLIFVNFQSVLNININTALTISDIECTRATITVGSGAIAFIEGNVTGTVTGHRYYLYRGGSIQSAGKGANAIPGTIDGYTDNGTGSMYY